MATYGRGQMLGSGINPESFKQDYSGFARAAEIEAKGMSDLGASIGGVIKDFGDEKKKINQDIAKGKSALQFAKANYPELASRIDEIGKIFSDVNVSKADQAAAGSQMGEFVTAMIRGQEFNTEVELKKRALGIQEAEARARNAPSPRSANLQLEEIRETINGKPYDVKVTFDPATGETRRLDGSIVSQGSRNPAVIDAGLNLPMPTAEGTAMPGNGTFPNYVDVPDGGVLPPIDPNDIAAAVELTGGQSDVSNVSPMPPGTPTTTQIPPEEQPTTQNQGKIGFTPVKTEKPNATSRIVTGQEAVGLGGDPNKKYIIKEVGKDVTDMAVVPPDITPAEERARKEDEDKKAITKRAGEVTVKSISKFIDKKGNATKALSESVGFGEEFATGVARYAPFLGTQSPANRGSQKELAILVEKGLLEAASELKPVSNTDLLLLKANRPRITDPEELWVNWLKGVRDILGDPNSYKEEGSKTTPAAPQSVTDRLKGLR